MPLSLRFLLLTIIGHQHRALTLAYAMMRAERDCYRALVPRGTKLTLTPVWRRTFGVLGKSVSWKELGKIATAAHVHTFQRWYRLASRAPQGTQKIHFNGRENWLNTRQSIGGARLI